MKKLLSCLAVLSLFVGMIPAARAADYAQADDLPLKLQVGDRVTEAAAFNASYDYNTYVSLRSVAEALNGTAKQFSFRAEYTTGDGQYFSIRTGESYTPLPRNQELKNEEEKLWLGLARNRLFVDGAEKKYYTYLYGEPKDLFISLTDLMLLFDIGAEFTASDAVRLYPEKTFAADLESLKKEGYFDTVNSVLVGNAETGMIRFSVNQGRAFPIASTSKLMTYLLVAEAIDRGALHFSDEVLISPAAEKVSASEDGIIEMHSGDRVPVSQLLDAMLLASSNESAVALAEAVSGTEAEFVKAMNAKAEELHMHSARFFNSNGLPKIRAGTIPAKQQNYMSSKDMFTLVCQILKEHPEITDITAKQYATMEALDYTTANSNPLVFNMSGRVTGLKTGNTKAAGQCLVACDSAGQIVIVLGAEDAASRGRIAEILFRCA